MSQMGQLNNLKSNFNNRNPSDKLKNDDGTEEANADNQNMTFNNFEQVQKFSNLN